MKRYYCLAWLFAAVVAASQDTTVANREVEVSVKAHSWISTPQNILCEALAYHDNLEDRVSFLTALVTTSTSELSYETALDLALKATPLTGGAKQLYRLSLVARAHSPQCELHRGLAQATLLQQEQKISADAFLVADGKVYFEDNLDGFGRLEVLVKGVSVNSTNLLPDEYVYGTKSDTKGPIIVYGNLGSQSFASIYNKVVQSKVAFVVRHLGDVSDAVSPSGGTTLQGYGVRIDIRNVEYKVFDDRADEVAEKTIGSSNLTVRSQTHFLGGVNVSALGLNDIKLQEKLWSIHVNMNAQSEIIPPVWRRRHLALQATTAILGGSQDPLVTLQQISQDLPSLASTLVQIKVPESIRAAAELIEEEKRIQPDSLFINGAYVSTGMPTFNVFEFIETIREEQRTVNKIKDRFSGILSAKSLGAVQSAFSEGSSFFTEKGASAEDEADIEVLTNPMRIDVGSRWKNSIIYLNDLEKESVYDNWPSSVRQMLMSLQMGGAPSVRRNLFTVLVVYDPIDNPNNAGLSFALQLLQSAYPVRIGLLVVSQNQINACARYLTKENPDENEPCPVDAMFDTSTKIDQMKTVKVGTQAIHRLLLVAQREMRKQPGALLTYFEYVFDALATAKETGKMFTLFDLLKLHGQTFEKLKIDKESKARAAAFQYLLMKDENEDYLKYGHALRFSVDRGLEPGMSFLNGRPLPTTNGDMESLNQLFGNELNHVLSMVVHGQITDSQPKSVYGKLLSGDKVHKQYHPLLLEQDGTTTYFGVSDTFDDSSVLPTSGPSTGTAIVVDGVLDYCTDNGSAIAKAILEFAASSISIVDSSIFALFRVLPSTVEAAESALCPLFAHASSIGVSKLLQALKDVSCEFSTIDSAISKLALPDEVAVTLRKSVHCSSQAYLQKPLPSTNFVTGNGRYYDLTGRGLNRRDVELLLSVESKRADKVARMLHDFSPEKDAANHLAVSRVATFLSVEAESPKSRTDAVGILTTLKEEAKDVLYSSFNEVSDEEDMQVCD